MPSLFAMRPFSCQELRGTALQQHPGGQLLAVEALTRRPTRVLLRLPSCLRRVSHVEEDKLVAVLHTQQLPQEKGASRGAPVRLSSLEGRVADAHLPQLPWRSRRTDDDSKHAVPTKNSATTRGLHEAAAPAFPRPFLPPHLPGSSWRGSSAGLGRESSRLASPWPR